MSHDPVHRYTDGTVYRMAEGRNENPQDQLIDRRSYSHALAVMSLTKDVKTAKFVQVVCREMKIRFYGKKSISNYRSALTSFFRWSGVAPYQVTRELIREYLLYLVDGGRSSSTVTLHLTAIRTAFDKFCFLDVTLGLAMPRKRKRLPVILSRDEVQRLLQAATSRRDTLVLGLMYATGMRVSEVAKLKLQDIDIDRNLIVIRQGKGGVDRTVMLPQSYRELFAGLVHHSNKLEFLFPSENDRIGRHIAPRTIQRAMERAVSLAGIRKPATPHSLRHSFATHSYENGFDIRRIQEVLGHVRLETTTIYVHSSQKSEAITMPSPLDSIQTSIPAADSKANPNGQSSTQPSVGRLRIHVKKFDREIGTRVTLEVCRNNTPVFLTGIRATQIRSGFWTLEFPPQETWTPTLSKLSNEQRARFQSYEFYLMIQDRIVNKVRCGIAKQCVAT